VKYICSCSPDVELAMTQVSASHRFRQTWFRTGLSDFRYPSLFPRNKNTGGRCPSVFCFTFEPHTNRFALGRLLRAYPHECVSVWKVPCIDSPASAGWNILLAKNPPATLLLSLQSSVFCFTFEPHTNRFALGRLLRTYPHECVSVWTVPCIDSPASAGWSLLLAKNPPATLLLSLQSSVFCFTFEPHTNRFALGRL